MDDANTAADTPWPDPWDDPHDVEYWVWNGEQLAPASDNERAAIQVEERLRSARRRLAQWERIQRAGSRRRHVVTGLVWDVARRLHLR